MKIKQFISEFVKYNSFLSPNKKAQFNLQSMKQALSWGQQPPALELPDPQISWAEGMRNVGLR